MNTLWIFGDSFGWDFNLIKKQQPHTSTKHIWDYIEKHLDGKIFESWGEQLAKNLGLNYVNHSCNQNNYNISNLHLFNSNNSSINLLYEFLPKFKNGDIVLHGFTDITRFDWVCELGTKKYNTFNAGNICGWGDETDKILKNIIVQRSEPLYIYDLIHKFKPIEMLSEIIGFDLWYWDWNGCFDKFVCDKLIPNDRWIFFHAHPNYTNYKNMMWEDYKTGPICWETNYENPDTHYGKEGHKVHAEVLAKFLNKKQIIK